MLTLKEISEFLASSKGWNLDGNALCVERVFKNFAEALAFVNKVGEIAEKNKHYPIILLDIHKVKLNLNSYLQNGEQGIAEQDVSMAKEIDEIV